MEIQKKLSNGVGEYEVENSLIKKRNRSENLEDEEEEEEVLVLAMDPLEVFGRDMMMVILNNLDARSVVLSLLVSRAWHGVASSDRLWTFKCDELWHGKAHIPRASQARGLSKLAAYSISVMDGKRTRIMRDDLCDHVWEFHFNEAAPEYWRNLDPYWRGTYPLMRRYFHPDGSQTADPDDKVWGGHECCYCIVTSIVGDGTIREHYVRINRWPRLYVSRNQDWSWEMSSRLYCYSSIPDADKEGGTGPFILPAITITPQAFGTISRGNFIETPNPKAAVIPRTTFQGKPSFRFQRDPEFDVLPIFKIQCGILKSFGIELGVPFNCTCIVEE